MGNPPPTLISAPSLTYSLLSEVTQGTATRHGTDYEQHLDNLRRKGLLVVLEKSNVAKLASALYLLVHSLPEEDHHDTDDASPGEL
jgi:hypothetical protein